MMMMMMMVIVVVVVVMMICLLTDFSASVLDPPLVSVFSAQI